MKLTDWTNNKSAIADARQLQSTEIYKMMQEVLAEETPLSRVPIPFGASPTDFAYAHGMQKGYEYALKVLKALGAEAPEIPQEPEATFSSSNQNER
jgi:hypothetical protein